MPTIGFTEISRRQFMQSGISIALLPLLTGAKRRPFRISLLGQSLIKTDLRQIGWNAEASFRSLFKKSDAIFTDLEAVIVGPLAGQPTREQGSETLHVGDPTVVNCLQSIGINLVATSNNHAWDLGTGGILSTIDALRQRRLIFAGTGRNLTEASAPASLDGRGKVALVAAAAGAIRDGAAATDTRPGVNELRRTADGTMMPVDVERYLAAIRLANSAGATVIAYLHNHCWETPKSKTPPWQRELARQAIDAGAVSFVAHGVPELQGIAYYRGSPLFHGLASFVFQSEKPDGFYGPEAWQSLVAQLQISDGRVTATDLIPIQLDAEGVIHNGRPVRGSPSLASGPSALNITKRVLDLSHQLGPSARFGEVKASQYGSSVVSVSEI